MGLWRPKLTNLDPFFCKMSMSIWIRGTTIFLAVIFTFLAPKIGHFWGAWSLCQIWGSTLPSLRFYRGMSQFYKEWMMVSNNKNVLVAVQLKEVDSPQRLRMMNRNMKLCLAVISLCQIWDSALWNLRSGKAVEWWKAVGSALPDLRFCLDGTSNLAKWPPGLRGSKESTFFGG